MSTDKKKISNRLACLRAQRDLTLAEVSRLIGLSESLISRHESGDRRLSREQCVDYARIYRCTTLEVYIDPTAVYDNADRD